MNDTGAGVLTAFQVRVARLFFSLPASEGFLLAGGAVGGAEPDNASDAGSRLLH